MKLIHCEYCGTEYNDDLEKCPLCGRSESAGEKGNASRRGSGRGGTRVASKKGKKSRKINLSARYK